MRSPAEEEICRRFAPRIRLYGLKHLRDDDRARDLVQSVLVAVIEAVRANRVEHMDHLDRFVLGTCRNLVRRSRHEAARAEPTELKALDAALGGAVDAGEGVDIGALRRCMDCLDARERTVIFLSFHRERSADEIASALALTPGNVRVVRHRAVARLRECLDHPQELRR